jgi:hypothetical protein
VDLSGGSPAKRFRIADLRLRIVDLRLRIVDLRLKQPKTESHIFRGSETYMLEFCSLPQLWVKGVKLL